ncbi:MAG: 2-C-methyl-D-erythritol 4-phosphate cytidylyltransferase [Verrucomicrobiota bacterium]|nr:2-C-methyl-D-erythritol 4-phosphate cytidylyltransferase [Verrucomicrobiota bacterium]
MHGVILLAAGSGKRMGNIIDDKILEPIGRSNAFRMSFHAFAKVEAIEVFVIVFRDEEQRNKLEKEINEFKFSKRNKTILLIKGGKERSDSVQNGLNALPKACQFAHIHDCARPMIRRETIETLVSEVSQNKAVVVARPVTNTIRRKLASDEISPTETLPRKELWEMETPQSAPISWLVEGYERAKEINIEITDDMHAIELLSKKMAFHEPAYANPKVTHLHDIKFISSLMNHE